MLALEDRATELGVKTKFSKLLNAYKKVDRAMKENRSYEPSLVETGLISQALMITCAAAYG